MLTDEIHGNEAEAGFGPALARLRADASDQVLMSQDRCVDALLDLHPTAATEVVRRLVAELLADISQVKAVRCSDLIPRLDELAAAAAVEEALFG